MPARLVVPSDARVFLGRLTRLDPNAVVRLRPAGAGRTELWARLPWGVLATRDLATTVPEDLTVGAAALLAALPGPAAAGGSATAGPATVEPATVEPVATGPAAAGPATVEPVTAGAARAGPVAARMVTATGLPPRRDREWRWPLPPDPGEVLEEIPARRLAEVAAAAARTLREVTTTGLAGRPVGVRMLREALLDHVPIVVESPAGPAGPAGRVEVPQRLVQGVVRMGFLGRVTDPGAVVRVRRSQRWVGLAARYGTGWLPPPPGPLTVRPRSA
ncbi:MAG: hypothetical protein GEV12_08085 [Micromonosporaceae bacterium]|nr:hypothetical protein [Micromonosporaceae bacterium]